MAILLKLSSVAIHGQATLKRSILDDYRKYVSAYFSILLSSV